MLRSDTYSLKYEVTVDTAEEGFQYDVDYPANGNTDLHYKDENGEDKTQKIEVPDVDAPKPKQPTVSFKNGEASNISFMLIDAEGNVEFLKKIDIENETSFEIPYEAGKISAVFVKQSTSGMFWTSEEVDEATRNAVIECLKDNNPSYKGYNAFTFGAGSFELEFKSGRFATYTFTGVKEGDYVKPEEAPEVEIPEVETPEEETTPEEDAKPEEEVTDKEAQKAANKAEKEAKKAAKKSK
jgi:hypothetical protein